MTSSAFGAAARIALRSFWSADRFSALSGFRYSSMVLGLVDIVGQQELLIALGRVTRRERSGRELRIDGLHEHALLAVRQVRLTLSRRRYETGGRLLETQRVVDARKVDGVLDAAAHHCLLVVGIRRVSPSCQ